MKYGVSALVFYPDIIDFGPLLPGIAVKRDSLLTMAQLHDHQVSSGNSIYFLGLRKQIWLLL